MKSQPTYIDITTISELHHYYNYGKPKHPLITIINLTEARPNRPAEEAFFRVGFYSIFCKRFDGIMKYGRSHYDFEEGSLMFSAPGQIISTSSGTTYVEGWGLFFHPDLLNRTGLGRKIHDYSFFNYDANEALQISDEEKNTLSDCLKKIENEYQQNIDKHSQGLIVDNLQLMLNYCNRFYDRQFFTRAKVNNDIVQRFESVLKKYFSQETLIDIGLPDVKYFASELNLSSSYLSDLLNKYTGKTTQEHMHLHLIEKAKSLLLGTEKSISEIAYTLGFEHPSHFTKLFKTKTGKAPTEYRHLN